jgi:DNA repair exonuclease SbcCD ATPase subunit
VGKEKDEGGDLATAAEALETELRRYAELATSLQASRLASEKDLRRAAQALNELRTSDARLGELVQALVAAVASARDRQQSQADAVRARTVEIARRSETLTSLLSRFEALGKDAAEVNRLVQQSASGDSEANGPGHAGLQEADARLGRLADDARAIEQAAQAEEFMELARRAESTRTQLLSARNALRRLAPP